MPTKSPTNITFDQASQSLSDNGYPIVPLVANEKRPALANWVNYTFSGESYPGYGIGIITGQERDKCWPVYGVDIDVKDTRIAEEFRDDIQRKYGATIWRVGQAPKCLLVYRATKHGEAKRKSQEYSIGHLEILSHGQQFVAFGTHPDTKLEYTWPGILGSPLEVNVSDLPALSPEQISDILEMFESTVSAAGYKPVGPKTLVATPDTGEVDDLELLMAPNVGLTLDEAWHHAKALDPDDRETWINVGMALHHEFKASSGAYDLWNDWSITSSKYKVGECEDFWARFGRHEGKRRPITARWLIKTSNTLRTNAERDRLTSTSMVLQSDIEACASHSVLLSDLAPQIGLEPYDAGTKTVLKNAVRVAFTRLTNAKLSVKDLNNAIKVRVEVSRKHELTEMGNASRLVEQHGKDIMYSPEMDRWYRWDGYRWCPCVRELVLRLADKVVHGIKAEADQCGDEDDKEKLYGWCMASQKSAMLDNMIKLAQKEKNIMVSPHRLDSNPDLLGVANGAIHLPTGDLIDPKREHRLTLNTGVAYDPEATAPLFVQTVHDAFFGDKEMAEFLQRLVGYAILGQPEKEEIVVIPEGKGANGKSTIFNALAHTLGAYAKFAGADSFTGPNSGGNSGGAREDVLRLMGSRFVYVTELEENGVLRESFIKGMTGGEAIPARGLYSKHTVEILPTWVAFMPTNHLPIVKGEDKGIWRKLVVVPFHRDFTTDLILEKDVNRKAKLKAEAPGILRWCVEGAMAYCKRGLDIPASIKRASEEYKSEMDLLSDWINSCCTLGGDLVASNADLWSSWEYFARSEGMLHLVSSSANLSRRLAGRGFERIRGAYGIKGRGFKGITVAPLEM